MDAPRAAVLAASTFGMASMAATALRQLGVIRHLPDPPLRGFDSDRVNLSPHAFPLGVPDGLIAFASFASNLPLAAWGGPRRAFTHPRLTLAIGGKAAVEAVISIAFFLQMPLREKAWCAYCIVAAAANVVVFGLSVPETRAALATLRSRGTL